MTYRWALVGRDATQSSLRGTREVDRERRLEKLTGWTWDPLGEQREGSE